MPAEFGHDRRKLFCRGERHAAAIMQLPTAKEMVEAQAAHTKPVPLAQGRRRNIGVGYRDAAQALGLTFQRVEHRGIVAAMRAALHQYAAGQADRI